MMVSSILAYCGEVACARRAGTGGKVKRTTGTFLRSLRGWGRKAEVKVLLSKRLEMLLPLASVFDSTSSSSSSASTCST